MLCTMTAGVEVINIFHKQQEESYDSYNFNLAMSTSLEEICSDRDTDSSDSIQRSVTADEVLDDLGCGLFQIMAYLLSALTFTAYAFVIMSFPLVNESVTHAFALSSVVYATLPATSFLGNSIGSVVFGYLSDSLHRLQARGKDMMTNAYAVNVSALSKYAMIWNRPHPRSSSTSSAVTDRCMESLLSVSRSEHISSSDVDIAKLKLYES